MFTAVNKCLSMRVKVKQELLSIIQLNNSKQLLSTYIGSVEKPEIPNCPRPTLVENLKSLVSWGRARRLHEFVDNQHRDLGPIFRMQIGAFTAIFVNSPESYQRIFQLEGSTPLNYVPEAWTLYNEMRKCPRGLLFMNGEEWLSNRRKLNKILLNPCTAKDIIINSCENAAIELSNEWKFFADAGKTVPELERRFYLWSIEVIAATLMGTPWNRHKKELAEDLNILADNLHQVFFQSAKLQALPAKLAAQFQLPVWRKFVRVSDITLSIAKKIFLRIDEVSDNGVLELMKATGIRNEDLVRIATDMIIAAGDTTTFSTQWALYLLAIHQDVQEKLFDICRSSSSQEVIDNPYMKGVFRESLRLFPTAPFLMRSLPQDGVIEGYPVRQGEFLIMSLYSSGRDNKNFPQAEKFSPERWTRDSNNKLGNVINPLGSLPFAAGARSCLGRKLAEIQMTLTISELIKTFRITGDNAESIKMILHLISVPSESLKLRLKPRN